MDSPFRMPSQKARPEPVVSHTWDSLCAALGYSTAVKTSGLQTLQQLQASHDKLGTATGAQATQGQLAAAAFLGSSLGKGTPGVSVTALTTHLGMHFKDFLNHVEEQHSRIRPGVALPELVPLKKAFLVSTIAHAKWKDFNRSLLPLGLGEADEAQLAHEIGWLLFAIAKALSAPAAAPAPSGAAAAAPSAAHNDPLSAYHLLAGIVHLLLGHVGAPAHGHGAFFPKLGAPVPAAAYPLPAAAQAALWATLKADAGLVERQAPVVALLLDELRGTLGLSAPSAGGGGLAGLLQAGGLTPCLEALRTCYAGLWPGRCQLDDVYFLSPQPTAPRVAPSVPASPARAGRLATSTSSSPAPSGRHSQLTPLRGSNPMGRATCPQTPMSSQLESVGWLARAVDGPSEPSHALQRFYDACEPSPQAAIAQRLAKLGGHLTGVLTAAGGEKPSDVAAQLELGYRLYHKLLLSFLQAEERRLRQSNFAPLLNNDSFHTSLYACCLESVFASYSTASMAFPAVLSHLQLHAFDFGKVIESFIKHEPHLPAHLKAHFAEVDAKIIECLAWADGSPLHTLMAEYDHSVSAAAAAAAAGSPAAAAAAAPSRAKAALEQFVKKCLYVAAKRLQDMCLGLLLPNTLVQQVWEVAKLVLDSCRHLLLGRHLDQILMCAVYGVCKVNQRQVTFRYIIEQYKRQPSASPHVFREVRMRSAADKPEDIIQFYNVIFIPAMKDHLLRACSASGAPPAAGAGGVVAGVASAAERRSGPSPGGARPHAAAAGSPAGLRSPGIGESRGASSPRHVSAGGSRDVYVSAQRQGTPVNMTPRTRTLYAFSDTPAASASERLRDINTNINAAACPDNAASTLAAMAAQMQPAPVLAAGASSPGCSGAGSPAPSTAPGAAESSGSTAKRPRSELDLGLGGGGGGAGIMAAGVMKRGRNHLMENRSSSAASGSNSGGDEPSPDER